MKYVTFAAALVIGALGSSSVLATTDVEGGKDHPLISRYKHSYIQQYSETDYDAYKLATGPIDVKADMPPVENLEGKITTVVYETKTNTESVLKVYRNYEHALKKSGFTPIFSCANAECGEKLIPKLYGDSPRKSHYSKLDPWNIISRRSDFRLLTGSLESAGDPVYVSLLVANATRGNYPVKISLDVIEVKDMDQDLVTVNAQALAESVSATGKAILEGIYFDTGKATIRQESNGAISEIATYLRRHPEHRVFIVGHTDSTGVYQHNLDLSQKRAEAVVNALYSDHGLAKERVMPVGIGEVSPQTSNEDEDGRARNRRVEMVLMSR